MAKVVKRENEDIESMLRRFRRKVNDENVLGEMKKREAFRSKSEIKRLQKKEAKRKAQRAQRIEFQKEQRQEAFKRGYGYGYIQKEKTDRPDC